MTVLIVWPKAEQVAERLRPQFPQLRIDTADSYEAAAESLEETEILVATGLGLNPETVASMPRLRWIHSPISGTDPLIAPLAGRDDILVTSSRGIHGVPMAEMAITHMLWFAKRLGTITRNQREHRWRRDDLAELAGKTVGIVGLGTSGFRLAALCSAFEMRVLGVSRTDRPVPGVQQIFDRTRLAEVAAQVDFLVMAVPLSPETTDLVDATVLGAMRDSAYLINIARGGVVNEAALLDALRAGTIAGAGLDVFATDPLPADSPFWDLDNVLVTPHVAGHSDRYEDRLVEIVAPNLSRFLAGEEERMANVV